MELNRVLTSVFCVDTNLLLDTSAQGYLIKKNILLITYVADKTLSIKHTELY